MNIDTLLNKIIDSLKKGRSTPKHPFRYVSLATSVNDEVFQRMVVFRKIDGNIITVYTDSRTPKVEQLRMNSNASLLFWDDKRMTQIHLKGQVFIDLDKDLSIWNGLSDNAKKDYTSLKVPGNKTSTTEELQFLNDQNFFCKLQFHFTEIDYLQIARPNHTRAKYIFTDNKWKGSYVVP